MGELDILDLWQNSVSKGGRICAVCLKPEYCQPLKHCAPLSALLEILQPVLPYKYRSSRTCMMCGVQAGRALRLLRALRGASRAQKLFLDLAQGQHWEVQSAGREVEALVRGARRAALRRTDVLQLGAGGEGAAHTVQQVYDPLTETIIISDNTTGGVVTGEPWTEIETVVLDDEPDCTVPPAPAPAPAPAAPGQPATRPAPRLVPLEKLLSSTALKEMEQAALVPDRSHLLSYTSSNPTTFLLHPLVRGTTPAGPTAELYVPSLGMALVGDTLLPASAEVLSSLPTIVTPDTGQLQALIQQLTDYVAKRTENESSLSNKMESNSVITAHSESNSASHSAKSNKNPRNSVVPNKHVYNNVASNKYVNDNVGSNKYVNNNVGSNKYVNNNVGSNEYVNNNVAANKHVNNSVPNISTYNSAISNGVVNDNDADIVMIVDSVLASKVAENEQKRSASVIKSAKKIRNDTYVVDLETINRFIEDGEKSARRQVPKPPAAKNNKTIDWEDKIPMDVISFMDATDPHADALMASCTEARTAVSSPPVIDLC